MPYPTIAMKTAAELGLTQEELDAQVALAEEVLAEIIQEESAKAPYPPCSMCGSTDGTDEDYNGTLFIGGDWPRCLSCHGA